MLGNVVLKRGMGLMENGKLIVIEGSCDGIGKTTQYQLLGKHLREDGYDVVTHHFPSYGTPQGELVTKYLRGDFGQPYELSPYFINSLYAIDRAYTWYHDLKREYESGKIILLDRYTTSSLIYQSSLIEDLSQKKEFIDYVCCYEYEKLDIPEPDDVIFLFAPFDLVTKYRNQRKYNEGVVNDIHESNLDYMKHVYDNAMFMADYLEWEKVQCHQQNQMRTIDEIHNDVYRLVKKGK